MKSFCLFVIFGLAFAVQAHADIYKRVDKDGHVTYSSEPLKGGKRIELKPLPVMESRPRESRSSSRENFPKVDRSTQKKRDETRRTILLDELSSEQKLLDAARATLQDLESHPPPMVGPDGLPFREYAPYQEKLKAAQNDVATHEQNVKALDTELSNIK